MCVPCDLQERADQKPPSCGWRSLTCSEGTLRLPRWSGTAKARWAQCGFPFQFWGRRLPAWLRDRRSEWAGRGPWALASCGSSRQGPRSATHYREERPSGSTLSNMNRRRRWCEANHFLFLAHDGNVITVTVVAGGVKSSRDELASCALTTRTWGLHLFLESVRHGAHGVEKSPAGS